MLDARTLEKIPGHWLHEAEYWRDTPLIWKRWTRPHDGWTKDCWCFCWGCFCDHRDRDRYDKPGTIEGGHYRRAFHAERPDGTDVWVCRTCFKRVQATFGWTVKSRSE